MVFTKELGFGFVVGWWWVVGGGGLGFFVFFFFFFWGGGGSLQGKLKSCILNPGFCRFHQ